MRLNTVMTRWQTATKQSFSSATDPETGEVVRTYFDNGEFRLTFISKTVGDAIIYTDEKLSLFERFHSLEDRAGFSVMEGYTYYVKAVLPTLNALGFADGYAYKVAKVGDNI